MLRNGRSRWAETRTPSRAPAFVEKIDRPKLTENVARGALMQYRDRTIEFIVPAGLAAMIDEYAIFGPKLGDRLPSFLGVSLSEHFVEIAFDEGLYRIRHVDDHPLRDLNALRISPTNSFGCSKAAKCPPLSSSFQ
jgi:hypothetical protein